MSKDMVSYSDSTIQVIDEALKTWKEFIVDQRPHPGRFEQHMMLVDTIESASDPTGLPTNINRYLTRTTEMNLAHSDGDPQFIYTKMAKMILLGFINCKHPKDWQGTKIHVKQGKIGGDIIIPSQFGDYLNERALVVQKYNDSMSKKQREVIAESYEKHTNRFGGYGPQWQ